MAIFPGSAIPTSGAAEYTIDQSLRFEDGSSAYLSRTPASAGNRKTWTWSGWVKRGNISSGTYNYLFTAKSGTPWGGIVLNTGTYIDRLQVTFTAGSANGTITTQVFRDPSAWYHFIVAVDTTQATASDRIKIYINGSQATDFDVTNYPAQNFETQFNNTIAHYIGSESGSGYFDGYLSEVHFIDGQALTPDYFGEVDETYGHWKPIRYTGTYGTNGFYLPFSGTFYNDASGNGNNWTANNLATTDVVLDSPTNNWCTLSSVDFANNSGYLSEGNLKISDTSSSNLTAAGGTFGFTSGKWYFEANLHIQENACYVGVVKNDQTIPGGTWNYTHTGLFAISGIGTAYVTDGAGSQNSAGTTVAQGDIIQVAYDADTGRIYFGKNGTWLNSADPAAGTGYLETTDNPEEGYRPIASVVGDASGYSDIYMNFGQDSSFSGIETAQNNTDANGYGDFYYPVPSGFLSLCSANLSEPAVVPGENFNTVLYTGTGSTGNAITGVGFQPDWVWIKGRNTAQNHNLMDAVRGPDYRLMTNNTNADNDQSAYGFSFDSDGFTPANVGNQNDSGYNFVAWNWKADNTSGSSNTDGSITSTVAANVDAGFSIVSYTGTGTNQTVGHGLGSTPELIILKSRDSVRSWPVYHASITNAETDFLYLNDTTATTTKTAYFNSTAPTSTVFSVGNGADTNESTKNHIAYCFHSVDGYSKFGSYTGNGSSDGPFVYTGFRPAFFLTKRTDTTSSWIMVDNKRDTYNLPLNELYANLSNAEGVAGRADFLSNGFKVRSGNATSNASGGTYIYMAFAEYDFKHSNGR